jgi:hypothetical protein
MDNPKRVRSELSFQSFMLLPTSIIDWIFDVLDGRHYVVARLPSYKLIISRKCHHRFLSHAISDRLEARHGVYTDNITSTRFTSITHPLPTPTYALVLVSEPEIGGYVLSASRIHPGHQLTFGCSTDIITTLLRCHLGIYNNKNVTSIRFIRHLLATAEIFGSVCSVLSNVRDINAEFTCANSMEYRLACWIKGCRKLVGSGITINGKSLTVPDKPCTRCSRPIGTLLAMSCDAKECNQSGSSVCHLCLPIVTTKEYRCRYHPSRFVHESCREPFECAFKASDTGVYCLQYSRCSECAAHEGIIPACMIHTSECLKCDRCITNEKSVYKLCDDCNSVQLNFI